MGKKGERHNRRYSAEEIEWLRKHVPGSPMREIVEPFNARFSHAKYEATVGSLQAICWHHGIRTGTKTAHWKDGRKLCGKTGKWVPVGTERLSRDGCRIVKVNENYGDKSVRWKKVHVLVWERVHGPVPKGHVVIFRDRNKRNCEIDNLLLVSRGELVQLNMRRMIQEDADLTSAGVALVKLRAAVKQRTKGEAPRP